MILFLHFLLTVVLASIWKIHVHVHQTLKTVLISKHLEVRQNTLPCVIFSAEPSLFENEVKHNLSCLIQVYTMYIKYSTCMFNETGNMV